MAKYYVAENKDFVVEDYNQAPAFSSFLPAVAGLRGKPLWTYYVNRGQCVSTFGVNNKDNAILEFSPANKAYRYTEREGFRTFLKIKTLGESYFYEPFKSQPPGGGITQRMYILSHDFRIEDVNAGLGIKTTVSYCTLPGERIAALVRKLTVENISGRDFEIEILDGLPAILPFYIPDVYIKTQSNLRQAWMRAEHSETIPFYRLGVLPDDTAETSFVNGGNFYINFCFENVGAVLSRAVVDPALIFGCATDFSYPENFAGCEFSVPGRQVDAGVTPCAFGWRKFALSRNAAKDIYSLIGYADGYEKVESFWNETLSEEYLTGKIEENRLIIKRLKQYNFTLSASGRFDSYCGQTMLDNILRGGCPIDLGGHSYYVYSRKHGDLEREYNFFQIDSTYYSQGNANFRDVNQNRRSDAAFFPFIKDTNVKTFFNLLQLDGFNPLVVKGSSFRVTDRPALDSLLEKSISPGQRKEARRFFERPFTPGSLMCFLDESEIRLIDSGPEDFLAGAMSLCEKIDEAEFSEGCWVDHWTYNTDLLEGFLSIFPDEAEGLLLDKKEYTYYDSDEFVLPRSGKYVLTERGVRQYGATRQDKEKRALIASRGDSPSLARDEYGRGKIYKTTLIAKIFNLLVNKIASLDPEGIGLEMEAGKPGWCDALNGLPGILGSSINESAELGRLARLILKLTGTVGGGRKIALHEELFDFYISITNLSQAGGFDYWDKSAAAREKYRERVFFGVSGKERALPLSEMRGFLEWIAAKVDEGLARAADEQSGVYATYFINEVTKYELIREGDNEGGEVKLSEGGLPFVRALEFRQRPIARFLEGPVHIMRLHPEKAAALHPAVRSTGLYDAGLDMYRVNENIMDETKEIGRQNVFPRGWLENEAVFLHMEYKYFLELLRAGMHDEFFHHLRHSMVPFLDPAVYGRSVFENSTFIASTAHPDSRIHGRGYVSRLTGASAEFLSMWLLMTAGPSPFFLDECGNLTLRFRPALPGWLFTGEDKTAGYFDQNSGINESQNSGINEISVPAGCFAFNFLGRILTVYHNELRKDTFGPDAAAVEKTLLTGPGGVTELNGDIIGMPFSRDIREGKYSRIDVYLK